MGIRYPDRELAPDPGIDPAALAAGVEAALAAAAAAPEAPAPEALAAVADPDVRELFAARLQSASAYPFVGLRARWLAEVPALLARQETRRVAGGNQRLAEALAAALPRPVELNTIVRAVRTTGSGLRVVSDRGEVEADACVVAVPCWAVGEIAFDPPLAAAGALAAIPVGTAAKLAVALREPAAPRAVMSVPGRWWTWSTGEGDAAGAWAGSAPVVEAVGGAAAWTDRVAALRPELALDRDDVVHTVWEQAYSVQRTDAEGPPGAPGVVLAGEHTAGAWTGTMEGALRSGLRAARQVLG